MPDNPFAPGAAPAAPVPPAKSSVTIHRDVEQGSQRWLDLRLGILTASEMKLILTPTLKIASNDKERAHLWELTSQTISKYVEPRYIGDDMLRGQVDEITARALYSATYEPVEEIGFITNNKWGFTLGYSPDGQIIGKPAGIECKSRRQKFQVETICTGDMPADYVIQVQTGLLVAEWEWIDFVSYSGGLPMATIRVHPDPIMADAIINAAGAFNARMAEKLAQYQDAMLSGLRLIPTERTIEQEIF